MPWKPKMRSSQWADRNSSILEAAEVIKKQKHDLEQRRAEKEAFEKDKEQRLRLKSQAHSFEKLRISRQVHQNQISPIRIFSSLSGSLSAH